MVTSMEFNAETQSGRGTSETESCTSEAINYQLASIQRPRTEIIQQNEVLARLPLGEVFFHFLEV